MRLQWRNLIVGDKVYSYKIGLKFVKIKGVGAFPLSEVGKLVEPTENYYCEMCNDYHDAAEQLSLGLTGYYVVYPEHIEAFLKEKQNELVQQ